MVSLVPLALLRVEGDETSLGRGRNKLGRSSEAIALLDKAMEMANEGQVNLLGYQYLQRGMTEKAIATFARNVKDHPDSWNAHDSLAEAQASHGMKKEAIANYKKALAMAPEGQKSRISSTVEGLLADG